MGFLSDAWNNSIHRQTRENRNNAIDLQEESGAFQRDMAERLGALSDASRQRYMEMYYPQVQKMAQAAEQGINPDYKAIGDTAVSDVGNAFDRSDTATTNDLARYGVTPAADVSAERARLSALDKSVAAVNAGNSAIGAARDRADTLDQTRGIQALSLGMGLPTQAAAGISGAAGAIGGVNNANLSTLISQGTDLNMLSGAAGRIAGNAYRNGGGVKKYADGGMVEDPRKIDTSRIEWLRRKLVGGTGEQAKGSQNKSEIEQLKELDPEIVAQGRKYADGGAVQLNTDDYIIPSDVVAQLGVPFFDSLVSDYGDKP
jgi:hypothetical protein